MVTRIAAHPAQPGRPGYGFVHKSVPLPRPARQGSGPYPTVNDLLVTAIILTVDRWNAAHGRRSATIRITVPVNDRDPQRRWEGPGNRSRLIRVTATPASAPTRLACSRRSRLRPGPPSVSPAPVWTR